MTLLACLIALALVGPWLVLRLTEGRRKRLTDGLRSEAPGQYASLRNGRTHFRWFGPADGHVMVSVHGLTTPSQVWDTLAQDLASQGWRVLVYDLYGRGFSDRPQRRHDRQLYVNQLHDLLDNQGIIGPVPLIGYSMGGAIVTAYADQFPHRVERLTLLASAGLGHNLTGLYAISARMPYLGDAIWSWAGGRMLVHEASGAGRDVIVDQIDRRGYLSAVLSAYRHFLSLDLNQAHRRIAARRIPVLAVWGAQDDVIPIAAKTRLAAANPKATQIVLAAADHALAVSHAKDIAHAIGPASKN